MSRFDYDLFVIGAGSAGVRAARAAGELGARVAIAEADQVGGTCVLRGCVPKKLFVHASHYAEAFEDAVGFGWTTEGLKFDWPTLVRNVTADTEWLSGIYIRNLEKANAEIVRSRAVLIDPHTVRLDDGRTVTANYVVIATGGAPWMGPSIPGGEYAVSSNEIFHLERLPRRLLIYGGGYIALEFAGVFNALGVETTILYRGDEIMRGFDVDVRKAVHAGLEHRGVAVVTGATIAAIEKGKGVLTAVTRAGRRLDSDLVLFATGRRPVTAGLGLEAIGVKLNAVTGAVAVDEYSRTEVENIYAVGDVTNRAQFTPVAIREGDAVAMTLFGGRPTAVDYSGLPNAVFSNPEVGAVGLTEDEARIRFPALDIYRANFKPLPNRVAGRNERMMIKLVVDADSGRVVGCHFVGPSAGEFAQLVAIALRMGATKADFDATTAIHPTLAEEIVTMRRPVERIRREAAE